MDKQAEIKDYLRSKFKPELPFCELDPSYRYEQHDRKCNELAEAILKFIDTGELLIKPRISLGRGTEDTGPK